MRALIIILLLTPLIFFGQSNDELDLCMAVQVNKFTSDKEAENSLKKILDVIGASKNFVLTECESIENAYATAYKGVRYILYDREFMNSINKKTNDWSNLFILAHEVGHHINGHSIDILLYAGDVVDTPLLEEKRKQELEADEFAAFILAQLGASINQLNNIITKLSDNSDDSYSTHPSTDKRLVSVRKGFNRGYIKKEPKTVYKEKIIYVDDSFTEKYDRDENYVKYGLWYIFKSNDPFFEDDDRYVITSGKVVGDKGVINKAPLLKIYKDGVGYLAEFKYSLLSDYFGKLKYYRVEHKGFEYLRKNPNDKNQYKEVETSWSGTHDIKLFRGAEMFFNAIVLDEDGRKICSVNFSTYLINQNAYSEDDARKFSELHWPIDSYPNRYKEYNIDHSNDHIDFRLVRNFSEISGKSISFSDAIIKGSKLLVKIDKIEMVERRMKSRYSGLGFMLHTYEKSLNTILNEFSNVYFEYSLIGSSKVISKLNE